MSFEYPDRQAGDVQLERELGWVDGLQSDHLRNVTDEVGRLPGQSSVATKLAQLQYEDLSSAARP
jgi:hypothetical protein